MSTVIGSSDDPASIAEYPSTVWSSTTTRNSAVPIPAYTANVVRFAPLNWRDRKMPSGTSGCSCRSSMNGNATSAIAPMTPATTSAGAQPCARPLDQRVHDTGEADRHGDRSGEVGSLARLRVVALGHVTHRNPHRHRGQREVDEEHQAPRHRVDEPAAEERADGGRHAGQPRPRPDRGALVSSRKLAEISARLPGTSRAPPTPCSARATMSMPMLGARPHSKDAPVNRDQADDEHPLPAVLVAERAAEEEQRTEREEVGVDGPLEAGDAAAEVVSMAGSATLTTVESRNAIPEPRMAARMTQRPATLPIRMVPAAAGAAGAALTSCRGRGRASRS